MAALPDKLPNPPAAPFFWSSGAWDWFAKALQNIYLAVRAQQPASQGAILDVLGNMNTVLEHLVTQSDSFQGAIDRNTAATAAETAAGATERAQLADISAKLTAALAQLSTSQAPTQAQLDQINAASQALEDATAADAADDPAPAA
jgi:hypothetical protein